MESVGGKMAKKYELVKNANQIVKQKMSEKTQKEIIQALRFAVNSKNDAAFATSLQNIITSIALIVDSVGINYAFLSELKYEMPNLGTSYEACRFLGDLCKRAYSSDWGEILLAHGFNDAGNTVKHKVINIKFDRDRALDAYNNIIECLATQYGLTAFNKWKTYPNFEDRNKTEEERKESYEEKAFNEAKELLVGNCDYKNGRIGEHISFRASLGKNGGMSYNKGKIRIPVNFSLSNYGSYRSKIGIEIYANKTKRRVASKVYSVDNNLNVSVEVVILESEIENGNEVVLLVEVSKAIGIPFLNLKFKKQQFILRRKISQ